MIPVARVPEPNDFDTRCRSPGRVWSDANPRVARPKPLWIPFTPALAAGFRDLCGYSALRLASGGTVDHFLSVKSRPDLAYEWSNYRYAAHELNACKKNADASILDPYEVGEGWFELTLPSLQLRATDKVPMAMRARADFTLQRLGLRDGERVLRARRKWLELYELGDLTLDGLRRCAPLIAEAVARATVATTSPKSTAKKTR